jgi:hypothetical protein
MGAVLRVGLLGECAGDAAGRLRELFAGDDSIVIVVRPEHDARPKCQLVVGVGPSTDAGLLSASDVWLARAEDIDELWRRRFVPFSANLIAGRRAPRRQQVVV